MATVNLHVGWLAILAGLVAGTVIGMGFHRDDWLGGYNSWRRRMVRLTHISLIGTGLLNLAFAFSLDRGDPSNAPAVASTLFVVGAITMPLVCGLSAWREAFRHLFPIPVVSLVGAVVDFVYEVLLS
jgi:hypothetical protein